MGWNIGIPSLKLNNVGNKSKHCGSFKSVAEEALQERKGRDPDIDPERSHLNIYEGYETAQELMEYSLQHISEISEAQKAAGGRKVRDDAVVMCSTIFKPPAAMVEDMSQEEKMKFLRDGVAKLEEIIGADNVKAKAFHFDEQGAHVHVLWEPMTTDGRLCAKELHNIKFFGRINREMPEYLRNKGWDVDDCQAYDAAKEELEKNEAREKRKKNGRSSAVYKRDMEREIKKLEADKQALQDDIQQQEEILQLIKDYDEYCREAVVIEHDMDRLEEAAAEMPEATKLFKSTAANKWLDRVMDLLRDLQRVIEAGIRRLKIFERRFEVEKPLSEPIEERKKGLDALISNADQRRLQQDSAQTPGKSKEQERE